MAATLALALAAAPAWAATAVPPRGHRDGAAFFAGGAVWQAVEAALARLGLFSSTSDPAGEGPEPPPAPPAEDEGEDSVALDPSATSSLGPEMDPEG